MSEITIPRESPLSIPMIMKAHWNAKEPFHLIGEPSTVKSALIKQTASNICQEEEDDREFVEWSKLTLDKKKEVSETPDKYFIFEDLRASETDIGELRLQDMNTENNYITYKYSLIFHTLSNPNAKGVLFFDEMNLASNMIKAQFYKVYNDRSIGDMPISDNILVCSAGNESSQVKDVIQDSVALTTRRGNYFINPLTSEEFVEYGVKIGIHNSIIGYLSFAPQDVHALKYDMMDPIGQPCARTWEKLSNIMKNSDLGIVDKTIIARGILGSAVATKFISYDKLADSIKLQDVIDDPNKAKNVKEIQIQYAIVSGLLARVKEGDNIMKVVYEVSLNIKEEIGIYMLRLAKKTLGINKFKKSVENNDDIYQKCYKKFGDLLVG